ncbi:reverse transcriptase domain-containing protein [Tanacetum coccineum]|uniref:Reverse transcriptase domain-containing protein n=1 Tax=Tanacetum coccineum TaxID=301880 RepID=A0ABQ5CKK0_9ASTR
MHIKNNVFDNVLGTLLNLDGKTKDKENSRKDLMEMGIRHELHLKNRPNKKAYLPLACYTMTSVEKSNFLQILKNLKVPDGYASNISRGVSLKDRKIMNLKSHDGHILMQDILMIALRASMFSRSQTRVVKVISDLCSFFKGLCNKVLDMRELDKMEHDVVQTLCELEQLFPPSFFTIMVHLTVHLISEAKPGIETPFNRPPRNDESIVGKEMYMLNSSGRKLGKIKIIELDWKSLNQAHRYVLLNHRKIQPFRDHFLSEQQALKGRPLDSKIIEKLFVEEFPQWLHNHVSFLEKNKFDEEVLSLAIGPKVIAKQFNGFITNGYRFLTKKREELKKTQNSGVIVAVEGGYYYGKLTNIIELDYYCGYKVVLFQPLVHTGEKLSDDPFIISSQAKQVFYIDDIRDVGWSHVILTKPRDIYDMGSDENKDEFDSYTQCMPCTIPILDDVNEALSWHRTNFEIEGSKAVNAREDTKELFETNFCHPVLTSGSSSSLLDNERDEINVVDEYQKKLLSEVEVIDEHGKILRIQKMTCKQVYKLQEGEKILVHVNQNNQLIKAAGSLCRRFMTLLLKEPKLCPLNFKDWTECKTGYGVRLLLELRKMSLNGKRARGGQVHIHTTGAHSFAWKRDEHKVLYDEDPNDVVFFGIAHTTLKGSFVTEAPGKFMAQAKRELSRKTKAISGSEPVDHDVEAEVARDVIQKLRPRGVTGHGPRVKKSQVTKFGIEYRRMRGEAISSEKRFLLDKVDCQSKKIKAQSKQIELLSKKNEAQSKKLESQSKKLKSQSKQIESLSKNNEIQSKQIECLTKKNETQIIKLNDMEEKMNLFTGELQLFKTAFPAIYSKSNTLSGMLLKLKTKKPNVVPISASKPKRKANKSVATPHKKTVASDTTIQKSKSYYKKLYENTNQEWKWWIAKRCPSAYTWTQKPLRTKKIWMPKIRKDDESTSISPTIDIVSRITNVLKISNSLGSNLSNVPPSSNSLADCTTHPIHC